MSVAERRYAAVREKCQRAMSSFRGEQRREWYIWASKKRPCPKCKMGYGLPCIHLGQLRKGIHLQTRWPHDERIDWLRMFDGLKQRGYIED